MPTTCFVPNCRTGYKRRKIENGPTAAISLFKAKNKEKLEEWQKAIPRKDKILSFKDLVCEKHFLPHQISRYYEEKMPDGSVFQLKRGRPQLHPDAVPSIFPGCPSYLSKNITKRKSPKKRSFSVHRVHKLGQQSITANDSTRTKHPIDDIDVQQYLAVEMNQASSDEENSSILNFEPPPGWFRNEINDSVVFFKWSDGKFERHFVIDEQKKMTFYLNNKMIRIKLQEIECTSTAVFSNVFKEFSDIKLCSSIAEKDSGCLGFLNNYESNACSLCYSCQLEQKKLKKRTDSLMRRQN